MTRINHFANRHRLRLRCAEDGGRVIKGRHGEIYEHADGLLGVLVMPNGHRPRLWSGARRRLEAVGCEIHQNGDGEGCALFSPEDGAQVRLVLRVIGAKPRRVAPPAQLESLRNARESLRFARTHCAEGVLEPQNDLNPAEMVGVGV